MAYPSAADARMTDVMETSVSKEEIRALLFSGKAVVEPEKSTHPSNRLASDVWEQFGKVRVLADGSLCNDAVACCKCFQVYIHRSKRQGTSSLRLHRCVDLLTGNCQT